MSFQSYYRYDQQAKVFIGHIPRLGIMTQATTKIRFTRAIENGARMFMRICQERGIKQSVLDLRYADGPKEGYEPFIVVSA